MSHYSRANEVAYGYFDIQKSPFGSRSTEYISALIVSISAAALPLAAFLPFLPRRVSRVPESVRLSGLFGLAVALSTYPRIAANQLAFASPFLIVPLCWFTIMLPNLWRRLSCCVALCTIVFLTTTIAVKKTFPITTEVGTVECSRFDRAVLADIQEHVRPGQTIFVYPYLPILYALTGTHPASYYSYLQPGMMDSTDEKRVLADCRRSSPSLIIWRRLSLDVIKRTWPSTDIERAGFPMLEEYIMHNYRRMQSSAGLPVEYWEPKSDKSRNKSIESFTKCSLNMSGLRQIIRKEPIREFI